MSHGGMPWCHIFQVHGHRHEYCVYMQNMVTKLMNLYCMFCRFVRNEYKDCRAYDLLQERNMEAMYYVKGEFHRTMERSPSQVVQPHPQQQPQFLPQLQPQFMPQPQFAPPPSQYNQIQYAPQHPNYTQPQYIQQQENPPKQQQLNQPQYQQEGVFREGF